MSQTISEKEIEFALEVWKTSIGVQEHFNMIEMQIRNIAVTVLTASIGAAGLVYNQNQENIREIIKAGQAAPDINTIHVLNLAFSSADMIIFAGIIAWLAFYFMDRWWYHRLLKGAVEQSQFIENKFKQTSYGDIMLLSNAIRDASPLKLSKKLVIRSNTKIDLFYLSVVLLLILIIVFVF